MSNHSYPINTFIAIAAHVNRTWHQRPSCPTMIDSYQCTQICTSSQSTAPLDPCTAFPVHHDFFTLLFLLRLTCRYRGRSTVVWLEGCLSFPSLQRGTVPSVGACMPTLRVHTWTYLVYYTVPYTSFYSTLMLSLRNCQLQVSPEPRVTPHADLQYIPSILLHLTLPTTLPHSWADGAQTGQLRIDSCLLSCYSRNLPFPSLPFPPPTLHLLFILAQS